MEDIAFIIGVKWLGVNPKHYSKLNSRKQGYTGKLTRTGSDSGEKK